MSTATSANWQPPTPVLVEPLAWKLPVSEIGDRAELAAGVLPRHDRLALDPDLAVLEREVLRLGVVQGGRDLLEQLVAGLGHGVVARGRASTGVVVEPPEAWPGGKVELPMFADDVGRLEAEDLGGDDRQDRPGAGAEVLGGRLELDRAVGVDGAGDLLALDCRRRPRCAGPCPCRAGSAPCPSCPRGLRFCASRSARPPS